MAKTKDRAVKFTRKADRGRHIDLLQLTEEFKAAAPNITGLTVNALHDVPQELIVHFDGEETLDETQIRDLHKRHVSKPKKKFREALESAAPEQRQKLLEEMMLRRFGNMEMDG